MPAAWALWLAVAASCMASPVPRAGRVAVALLPAWLLVPGAVAWAWRSAVARRWGVRGVALVVGAIAAWALAQLAAGGSERAAAPIGHHSLLAVWLLALLPLAAMAVRDGRAAWRASAWVATALAIVALVATGSLLGRAGLAVEAMSWAAWRLRGGGAGGASGQGGPEARDPAPAQLLPPPKPRRPRPARRRLLAVLLFLAFALVLTFTASRLGRIGAGTDPSLAARLVYTRAGWAGFLERPLLGWGPGATPWTVGLHLEPVPGINPPGEVVGELHALPLAVLYELGALGAVAAAVLAALFLRRCRRSVAEASDPALAVAGLLGLTGAAVGLLGTAWLAVTALPAALAVAAGAALAGSAGVAEEKPRPRFKAGRPLLCVYLPLACLALLPLDRARLAYDRAVRAEGDAPVEERWLAAAVAGDPDFPLYRARLAWRRAATAEGAGLAAAAEEARVAAEAAPGVAALRLAAGTLGSEAGAPWAVAALDRACELDRLSGRAAFYRAAMIPGDPAAAGRAARALLAEPEVGAATWWRGHPALLAEATERLRGWPGVDAGLRRDLAAAVEGAAAAPPGELFVRYLTIDPREDESLALRAFRRRSQEVRIAPVEVDLSAVARLDLPSAAVLPTTSPAAFAGPGCGAPVAVAVP